MTTLDFKYFFSMQNLVDFCLKCTRFEGFFVNFWTGGEPGLKSQQQYKAPIIFFVKYEKSGKGIFCKQDYSELFGVGKILEIKKILGSWIKKLYLIVKKMQYFIILGF